MRWGAFYAALLLCITLLATVTCWAEQAHAGQQVPSATQNRVQRWVKVIREHAATIRTIRATFKQRVFSGRFHLDPEPQTGELWVKIPGRMKWRYNEQKTEVVTGLKEAWVYDVEAKQALVSRGASKHQALGLLSGTVDLARTFHVEVGEESPRGVELFLRPREKMVGVERIRALYDTSKNVFTTLVIVDEGGRRNHIELDLKSIHINQPVSDAEFDIKSLPKGTFLTYSETPTDEFS